MGNHALRKEASRLLKEQGLGRLYEGRRQAIRWGMRAGQLRRLIDALRFRAGDRINDCDGFNCTIDHWIVEKYPYDRPNFTRSVSRFVKTSGSLSCGCGHFEAAVPVEELRARNKEWVESPDADPEYPWVKLPRQGYDLYTEEGELKPELRELYRSCATATVGE